MKQRGVLGYPLLLGRRAASVKMTRRAALLWGAAIVVATTPGRGSARRLRTGGQLVNTPGPTRFPSTHMRTG